MRVRRTVDPELRQARTDVLLGLLLGTALSLLILALSPRVGGLLPDTRCPPPPAPKARLR
jgi:hypothetical protein